LCWRSGAAAHCRVGLGGVRSISRQLERPSRRSPCDGCFPTVVTQSVGFGDERRLRRHMELLANAPDEVEAAPLKAIIEYETQLLAKRTHRRLTRKIDWVTVFTMLFVLLVVALSVLGLWWTSNSDLPTWLAVTCRVLAILIGVFGFLLTAAGSSQFWKDDGEEIPGSG
jgi:hypothetical protein